MLLERMKPVLNFSGTTASALVEMRLAAMTSIEAAMSALRKMHPDGRDYIGNPDQLRRDKEIHANRLAALHRLYRDIEAEALEIQERAGGDDAGA
ncbi:hypothetical protein GCM10011491_30280 [Brucella endophytica]|uniref:Uncharacterized protein n=1 Tax=Brucella endophytica TaxID=1963359 RepID=A0A916SGW8_9HYPH|nr:hypothetical protein [Brucella endophytica]GGA99980.1 hypothetical protein GCM10011491_30280 [Brucella endophytica]